jgi:hypothetical protein
VAAATGSRVAERVAWFYAVHPRGRIITDLVTRAREVAVFRAAVYRDAADPLPSATGWSSGNPAGAALERVEEAAVGRALANLGFAHPSGRAPSGGAAPEVTVADAPRPLALAGGGRAAGVAAAGRPGAMVPDDVAGGADAGWVDDPLDAEVRLLAADLTALVSRAERYGVRPRRAAAWRARLRAGRDAAPVLREAEHRLRAWVERRRAQPYAGAV